MLIWLVELVKLDSTHQCDNLHDTPVVSSLIPLGAGKAIMSVTSMDIPTTLCKLTSLGILPLTVDTFISVSASDNYTILSTKAYPLRI